MKKTNCIMALGALILSGCAQDSVISGGSPNSPNAEGTPMTFNVSKANQSRATGLETAHLDFGVWGYKTNDNDGGTGYADADLAKYTVMDNFLVGYYGWDATAENYFGYKPAATTPTDNSWIYEGLGSTQSPSYQEKTFAAGTAKAAKNETQYLKYWDDSYANTYFYAFAPYDAGVTIARDATKKTVSLTFPNATTSWKYAAAKYQSTQHAPVDLNFKALQSSIRLAFYNTIAGYDVQIVNYTASKTGIGFVPATATLTTATANGEQEIKYAAKTINMPGASSKPCVTFTIDGTTGAVSAPTVTLASPEAKSTGFTWDAPTVNISTSNSSPTYTSQQSIIPQNCECGFTLNVSFKLTAKDTGEELYVRGARVHVPATYFNWQDNHLYTYVFRITGNVPGTTGAFPDTDFSCVPNPIHALYPIVFDNITIESVTEEEIKTIVNALTIDKTSASVEVGATTTINAFIHSDFATDWTLTWKTSDASVATVNDGVVTGVKEGNAVITAILSKEGEIPFYAACQVTVTAATPVIP